MQEKEQTLPYGLRHKFKKFYDTLDIIHIYDKNGYMMKS